VKRLLALPLLALALAGCGSDSGNDEAASTNPPPPTTTNPSSPPPMQTVPECMAMPGAGLDAVTLEGSETKYLTGVTEDTEANGCSAFVEFVFMKEDGGHVPGFDVSYQPASSAKVEDGSGNPVEIEGDAFLVVKLTPAMTATIDGDQVTKTYTGPNRIKDDGPIVKEIVKTGDFESVVTWVIGLDKKRPFKSAASASTLDITIDGS